MARRKKTRRRGPKTFRILNALESLTYAQILSLGITGGGIWDFVTGTQDMTFKASSGTAATTAMKPMMFTPSSESEGWSNPDLQISLSDLMTHPGEGVTQMANNFQNNLVPMAASAFGVSVGFRIGKRLLRKPIANINRNLVKPALGAGIAL